MENEIFQKVQQILSEALGIEKEEIRGESSLVRDLGAESIDFIDIIFRLEKAFEIKIPSGELFPGNLFNDERFVKEGLVTSAGLEELKIRTPYLDIQAFAADPKVSRLADFFTASMVASYIQDKVAKSAQA